MTGHGLQFDILNGLVALRLAEFTQPEAHAAAAARAAETADVIAEYGDRITAPGNFTDPADRRDRGRAFAAMATAIALGAHQPGGITWAGHHWCTTPHVNCVNERKER